MTLRRFTAAIAVLVLPASSAVAQPSPSDAAFAQGKALMDQGHIPEACARFAESLALERRHGTLLNLAVCREKEGRYATALSLFHEGRERAVTDARSDREALADEGILRAGARVSTLTVKVPASAEAPDLAIEVDGAKLARDTWGTPLPIDPGAHIVTAVAAGRPRFETTVAVAVNGEREARDVEIPAPPPPPPPSAPEAVVGPPVAVPVAAPLERTPEPEHWRAPVGWVTVVLGAAALATGVGFGVRTIEDMNESNPLCPHDRCRTVTGYDDNLDAHTSAVVADVALPFGVAVAAVGTYLLLARRGHASSQRAAQNLRVDIGFARRGAVSLGGVFP